MTETTGPAQKPWTDKELAVWMGFPNHRALQMARSRHREDFPPGVKLNGRWLYRQSDSPC